VPSPPPNSSWKVNPGNWTLLQAQKRVEPGKLTVQAYLAGVAADSLSLMKLECTESYELGELHFYSHVLYEVCKSVFNEHNEHRVLLIIS
jgi:hypothetical protein